MIPTRNKIRRDPDLEEADSRVLMLSHSLGISPRDVQQFNDAKNNNEDDDTERAQMPATISSYSSSSSFELATLDWGSLRGLNATHVKFLSCAFRMGRLPKLQALFLPEHCLTFCDELIDIIGGNRDSSATEVRCLELLSWFPRCANHPPPSRRHTTGGSWWAAEASDDMLQHPLMPTSFCVMSDRDERVSNDSNSGDSDSSDDEAITGRQASTENSVARNIFDDGDASTRRRQQANDKKNKTKGARDDDDDKNKKKKKSDHFCPPPTSTQEHVKRWHTLCKLVLLCRRVPSLVCVCLPPSFAASSSVSDHDECDDGDSQDVTDSNSSHQHQQQLFDTFRNNSKYVGAVEKALTDESTSSVLNDRALSVSAATTRQHQTHGQQQQQHPLHGAMMNDVHSFLFGAEDDHHRHRQHHGDDDDDAKRHQQQQQQQQQTPINHHSPLLHETATTPNTSGSVSPALDLSVLRKQDTQPAMEPEPLPPPIITFNMETISDNQEHRHQQSHKQKQQQHAHRITRRENSNQLNFRRRAPPVPTGSFGAATQAVARVFNRNTQVCIFRQPAEFIEAQLPNPHSPEDVFDAAPPEVVSQVLRGLVDMCLAVNQLGAVKGISRCLWNVLDIVLGDTAVATDGHLQLRGDVGGDGGKENNNSNNDQLRLDRFLVSPNEKSAVETCAAALARNHPSFVFSPSSKCGDGVDDEQRHHQSAAVGPARAMIAGSSRSNNGIFPLESMSSTTATTVSLTRQRRERMAQRRQVLHRALQLLLLTPFGVPRMRATFWNKLTVLDLSGHGAYFGDDGAAIIAQFLRDSGGVTPVEHLALRDNLVSDVGFHEIMKALFVTQNQFLRELDFRRNAICDVAAKAMLGGLRSVRCVIRTLLLEENAVSVETASLLATALLLCGQPRTLRALVANMEDDVVAMFRAIELSRCGIDDLGCKLVLQALRRRAHATLTSIDLSHNRIGDDGAIVAARIIDACPMLKIMLLGSNEIGARGAEVLIVSAAAQRSLNTLDVTDQKPTPLPPQTLQRIDFSIALHGAPTAVQHQVAAVIRGDPTATTVTFKRVSEGLLQLSTHHIRVALSALSEAPKLVSIRKMEINQHAKEGSHCDIKSLLPDIFMTVAVRRIAILDLSGNGLDHTCTQALVTLLAGGLGGLGSGGDTSFLADVAATKSGLSPTGSFRTKQPSSRRPHQQQQHYFAASGVSDVEVGTTSTLLRFGGVASHSASERDSFQIPQLASSAALAEQGMLEEEDEDEDDGNASIEGGRNNNNDDDYEADDADDEIAVGQAYGKRYCLGGIRIAIESATFAAAGSGSKGVANLRKQRGSLERQRQQQQLKHSTSSFMNINNKNINNNNINSSQPNHKASGISLIGRSESFNFTVYPCNLSELILDDNDFSATAADHFYDVCMRRNNSLTRLSLKNNPRVSAKQMQEVQLACDLNYLGKLLKQRIVDMLLDKTSTSLVDLDVTPFVASSSSATAASLSALKNLNQHRQPEQQQQGDKNGIGAEGSNNATNSTFLIDAATVNSGSYHPIATTTTTTTTATATATATNNNLNINTTHFGDRGAQVLASALPHLMRVRAINLSRCAIGDAGATYIANVLSDSSINGSNSSSSGHHHHHQQQQHRALSSVDLSHNNISAIGAGVLLQALRVNISVQQLVLDGNPCAMDPELYRELLATLKHNRQLASVSTSASAIKGGAAAARGGSAASSQNNNNSSSVNIMIGGSSGTVVGGGGGGGSRGQAGMMFAAAWPEQQQRAVSANFSLDVDTDTSKLYSDTQQQRQEVDLNALKPKLRPSNLEYDETVRDYLREERRMQDAIFLDAMQSHWKVKK